MTDKQTLAQRNNLIRAAVMGANDGILSVSGIVIGVAGATTNSFAIFIAGFAGALAGTVSMAMGEYVSVHSQNDAQVKAEETQTVALKTDYATEFAFVQQKYMNQGISTDLAAQATREMMAKDALGTTVRERYGFTLHHEVSAIGAAVASMIAFPLGSVLPMLAITLLPPHVRVPATAGAVLIALAFTGYAAAHLSGANERRATVRNVVAGIFTMIVTYLIGSLIGH
ncbi:VIT1/CCC1 transporter family protein [Weissella cibaria]|jgi:VIT1/CCC1 family predicted Fe2+/Mn2+ transporter|uniref:VIT1/CCC1 transporter family protein n=1 Tax=Weissella cibaria TaxID=137591 RepID=UPI000FFE0811|nr:VIT family protein [Weissella cibaria]MBZ6070557.1 VIT family protein [Weissella cibaria]MCC6121606.1 VIT family protein [Weissella cibaria]MCT8399649.1 VIT family protein [Weissella cibaria]QAT25202.1 VIT family protein [Weissella cibaria]HJF38843.1 VIT family protein [Weissella cibaria]